MIADSTCIICLSKINRLDLLKKVFGSVLIPRDVQEEVFIAEKEGFKNIQNAFEGGWLKIVDARKVIDYGLGKGENAAISLARERKDTLILDDAFALKVTHALGVETLRTTSIIFIALKRRLITREEAIILLNKLIESGYYISPEFYAALLMRLK